MIELRQSLKKLKDTSVGVFFEQTEELQKNNSNPTKKIRKRIRIKKK